MKKIPEPTLLDLYAGFALMGLLARNEYDTADGFAVDAFEIAEAMLKQRTITMKGKRDE